jgi:hypothetical protein
MSSYHIDNKPLNADNEPIFRSAEQHILSAVRSIRFGSIEVVVHDGKVVQIERKEKVRFDKS